MACLRMDGDDDTALCSLGTHTIIISAAPKKKEGSTKGTKKHEERKEEAFRR
ncbi:MAG: hypothetical protein ETSY2_35425 [Candidatus Entotheonella gemina]|uniref:Uncharacterized protein n=1 Tax=Candidatus Entotheonella gemina TaxID=1429439 RepID=W4LYQ6_9BACT|nr:MAG: hypothetical protein ETSY2_35425 [Candidatus Entotheonella gemina]